MAGNYWSWAILTNFREPSVFSFFRPCVRTTLVLTFFYNRRLTRTVLGIRFFYPRKKFRFSSLMVLNNSRTASFLGWFSQVRSQKFQYIFSYIYIYIYIYIYNFIYLYFFGTKKIDIEGVGKLQCTQFDANLELHIISKI